jgi:4-amino-4-deoxy-L-arabinose transferase-like glycosyltransferase
MSRFLPRHGAWGNHAWPWAFLVAVAAVLLPPVPIDETRYLTVAWELHQGGHFPILTLNGQAYMDKPPLLFGLIDLAWLLAGDSLLVARLVSLAFAAGTLAVLGAIERRLVDGVRAPLAPWIMLPFVLFDALGGVVMFDVPLCFFVTAGMLAMLRWLREGRLAALACLFACAALGMLTKGPVMLVPLLGPLILAPWWNASAPRWGMRAGVALPTLLLAGAPLAWWGVHAAAHVAHATVWDTLFRQAFGRVTGSFAHQRGPAWYVAWLPLLLLPWTAWIRWRPLYRAAWDVRHAPAWRLGIAWSGVGAVLFSLISGKQAHYLLPLLPGVALALAAVVRERPETISHGRVAWAVALAAIACGWTLAGGPWNAPGREPWLAATTLASFALLALAIWFASDLPRRDSPVPATSIASLCIVVALLLQPGVALRRAPDVADLAAAVRTLRDRGTPLVALEDEPGMVGYVARLPDPLPVATRTEAAAWAAAHPDGFVLLRAGKGKPPPSARMAVRLTDGWEGLLPAAAVHRGAY